MTDQPLSGQVAVITGAANGIGQAYDAKLASLGADIACGDVKPADATAKIVEDAGRRVVGGILDAGSEESVTAFVAEVDEAFGRVEILVNNAAIFPYTLFEDMDFAEWRKVMSVNATDRS